MPDANPINPTYTFQNAYHDASRQATYSRIVQVSGSLNNPLTLTGSYANNAGFIVLQQGSVWLSFPGSTGQTFPSGQFHEVGAAHVIYPMALSYVSASFTGSVLVLYNS